MSAQLQTKPRRITQADFKIVAHALAKEAERVAQHLYPNGKAESGHWVVGNIHGDEATNSGSYRITLSGSKRGLCKDFASSEKAHDLLQAWQQSRGHTSLRDALIEAAAFVGVELGTGSPAPMPAPRKKPPAAPNRQQMSQESLKRQVAQFKKHPEPLTWLWEERGISEATAEEFGLGLPYKAYTGKDGITRDKALLAPVRMRDGNFAKKNIYINVPGFTQNPIHKKHWVAKGMTAMTYYAQAAGTQRFLFVCEGVKDLWRHWQALSEHGDAQEFLVISSTHGRGIPDEWTMDFFAKWDQVYLGHDNDDAGDQIVADILGRAGREMRRVKVPEQHGKDWTDFWNKGGNIEEFRQILREAPVVDQKIESSDGDNSPRVGFQRGRRSYRPIDIRGAYHNGCLYYITETINGVVDVDPNTGEVDKHELRETVVVRSDPERPKFFRAFPQPAPKGTPLAKRVIRLEDGTLIKRMPEPSGYETWEFDHILDFVNGEFKPRHLAQIVHDIKDLLKSTIWLPHEEDYATLALVVPVTFVQKVFESVPFVLLNGPKGTGKSQVAVFMADVCCNGNLATAPTPAGVFRHVDGAAGFVAFDDIEAIGSSKGKDNGTDELMQVLKVSYNQHTARIQRTDPKTGRPVEFNCFGVKLFTNILGTDSVLGSRMIRIQTSRMPEHVEHIRPLAAHEKLKLQALRKELHAWAFRHVRAVDAEYQAIFGKKTDRDDEIAAPLRVMAKLTGDPKLAAQLEVTLTRQKTEASTHYDSPELALEEALKNLVAQGFTEVTVTHIILEVSGLMDANAGQEFSNQVPVWRRPDWIGKTLATNGWAVNTGKRKRFFGKNLRIQELTEDFVEGVRAGFIEQGQELEIGTRGVEEFCQGCAGCQYRNNGCELMALRERARLSNAPKSRSVN